MLRGLYPIELCVVVLHSTRLGCGLNGLRLLRRRSTA